MASIWMPPVFPIYSCSGPCLVMRALRRRQPGGRAYQAQSAETGLAGAAGLAGSRQRPWFATASAAAAAAAGSR